MDAKQAELEGKLAELLKRAADVAFQIQVAKQGPGTPHYDEIEMPAHEVGQRLSRMVQMNRAGDVADELAASNRALRITNWLLTFRSRGRLIDPTNQSAVPASVRCYHSAKSCQWPSRCSFQQQFILQITSFPHGHR